jgi:hypothetical protein
VFKSKPFEGLRCKRYITWIVVKNAKHFSRIDILMPKLFDFLNKVWIVGNRGFTLRIKALSFKLTSIWCFALQRLVIYI